MPVVHGSIAAQVLGLLAAHSSEVFYSRSAVIQHYADKLFVAS